MTVNLDAAVVALIRECVVLRANKDEAHTYGTCAPLGSIRSRPL
jgi:hypothetical protein